MIDTTVKCDKPYDLDAYDKKNNRHRRKRENSKTTAYELTIRLSKEQKELMGKPKYVRVVYAKNKKEDLQKQKEAFKTEISAKIRDAALKSGLTVSGMETDVSSVVRAYLKTREKAVVSKYCQENIDLAERYIDPTIGKINFCDLTRDDIEKCLLAIPERSRELNEAKRKEQIKNRQEREKKQKAGIDKSTTHYPEFKPVRVASTPTQHKVLVLLNLTGRYALTKGIVQCNVADDKNLREQFPKSKPKVDNFREDESRYIFSEIKKLPLSARKVQFQLMFMCGLRPCEMCTLEFDDVNLRNPNRGCLHVVNSRKTENAAREIKLDPDTTALLIEWRDSRKAYAEQIGVLFQNSWLVCSDDGQRVVYNTFKQRWMYFLKHIGIKHHRPYSARHTFATMNARNNVDPRTLSTLMGHASPEFTLKVYAGFLESAAEPVITNYLGFLEEDANNENSNLL